MWWYNKNFIFCTGKTASKSIFFPAQYCYDEMKGEGDLRHGLKEDDYSKKLKKIQWNAIMLNYHLFKKQLLNISTNAVKKK